MTYRGRVCNGVVVLDDPKPLPEGAEVSVRPLQPRKRDSAAAAGKVTVGRALLRLAGRAKRLPRDASRNLDHYLYGHRKR
jgi:hypothetical protein